VHSIAKKLAVARYSNQGDPFNKDEFPTLKSIAIEVVAANFMMYPSL
jgi:hypothetical protein